MPNGILEAVFSKFLSSHVVSEKIEFLWHAGEPLTVGLDYFRNATRLCEQYNHNGIEIQHTVQTNGVLITQEWCDFFNEHNYCVGVSIDGPQHIHDYNRKTWGGKGSFKNVMRGFELLEKNGINAGVLSVLSANSLENPASIYDFFISIGAKWLAFNVEEVEGSNIHASTYNPESSVISNHYRTFMRYFFRRWSAEGKPFKIREFDDILAILQSVIAKNDYFRRPDETKPMSIVTIQKNGDVSTFSPEFAGAVSEKYSNFIIGNIISDSISEIANNNNLLAITNEIQRGIVNCAKTCKWFTFCGGGYISNKFYENGDVTSTETTACKLHRMALSEMLMGELTSLSKEKASNPAF